jgi:uncharacterized protein YndB with AHSA1/START domain
VSITVTVVAPAAADRVWERWTDFAAWPGWNPHCVEAELDGPVEPGSRLRLHMRDQNGRDFYTRPSLTAVEPDREIAWEARGLGLRARTRTALAPEPDGTRITVETLTLGPLAFAYRMAMTDRSEALIYVAVLDALTDTLRP